MINLSAFVRFHAERTPERIAIVYEDTRISFSELWERVGRLSGWLSARGIGEGDVVAVFMKNSPAFVEVALAASHLGAVFLPINYRLAQDEVAFIIDNSTARLLLADDEFAEVVGSIDNTVLIDAREQADIRLLAGTAEAPAICRRQPADLFRLMYTSGTTGRPKGVMHSYENFYWKSSDHVIALGLNAEDRLLIAGPLYHVGAFDLPGLAVTWVGGMLHILREFDELKALQAIHDEKLTCAWLAPVMLSRLLACEQRDRFDCRSLKWAIGGGERTPDNRIQAFAELFPNGRFIDGYGLTETCGGDTLMEAGREIEKIGTTGRALAHCEIDIRDDTGRSLPPHNEGEICVRGPKVTKGYWRDEAKTLESFFADGWFRTGDMGHVDEEGFLTITDRKKDMIISGGENIASSEVERVIYAMPQVAEVAVVGMPDAEWGERPVAVVVPKPGQNLDLETLRAHCLTHLARFKVPRALFLRNDLPRNPSGKILKRTLRDELAIET
ncbi:MAG: AMP-binding protein [Pararhodobacter sp.]|nr:AMP-binding protein [Pararhodobacter sp.]